ncbi:MAG: polyphosphate kinase 1 [Pseudomonadota bacterium]
MSELITKLWQRVSGGSTEPTVPIAPTASTIAPSPTWDVQYSPDPDTRLLNRELTDLMFIERVLALANVDTMPLLERLRFLAISADVLDQFYAVRVAKMRRSSARRDAFLTPDGLTPKQQLTMCLHRARSLLASQQATWAILAPQLERLGIAVLSQAELGNEETTWLRDYFEHNVRHVLAPTILDEEHPFPLVASGGVCVLLTLSDRHLLIPLPTPLPRFVRLPGQGWRFISIESIICLFWQSLFPEETLRGQGTFQILRDNDLARQEQSDDLRHIVETGLRLRQHANVIQINVSSDLSENGVHFLCEQLDLASMDQTMEAYAHYTYRSPMVGLAQLTELLNNDLTQSLTESVFPSFTPRMPQGFSECFNTIRTKDQLVHWPFESFDVMTAFLDQASTDPDVVAIKQTVYRTNDESPIINALIKAATAGKQVLAVIELEARDNEESNVAFAKRLEAAGVQIVYGIVGLKIHCKTSLVVRMEEGQAVTYAHFGTGNYHPGNARAYTDLSLFTRDPELTEDGHRVFTYLTTGKVVPPTTLAMAPFNLRQRVMDMISAEIRNARDGLPSGMIIKVNALIDPEVIEHLYEASNAGVQVFLLVRRQCRLRPGVAGMSENISVKSTVGRFLEHSRIMVFANGEPLSSHSSVYLGSPDMMERNLDERVEILVPVKDEDARALIVDGILHAYIKDTEQSTWLTANNSYESCHTDDPQNTFDAQMFLLENEHPEESLGPIGPQLPSK